MRDEEKKACFRSPFIPPPSSLIPSLCPFERAFAPRVIITDYQNADEDEHLDQREFGKRKIIAHEDDGPGQKKDRFDVETIFLLPWAIIFMGDDFSFTKFALIEMFVFIGILVVGYYYAWRKGALEWA